MKEPGEKKIIEYLYKKQKIQTQKNFVRNPLKKMASESNMQAATLFLFVVAIAGLVVAIVALNRVDNEIERLDALVEELQGLVGTVSTDLDTATTNLTATMQTADKNHATLADWAPKLTTDGLTGPYDHPQPVGP